MAIHPTAIVDKRAEIGADVEIGPYAVVESGVQIGAGTRLYGHAYVMSGTALGERCQIHPFAVIGDVPQDVKFDGAPTFVRLGDEVIAREGVTVHRGTTPGSTTSVGSRCFLMNNAHVGHNCAVGEGVVLASGALLGGHVQVGPRAFISGNVGVHQFVRIGELVMLGGGLVLVQDIPPFMLLATTGVAGPNVVGLRRAGLSAAERQEIRECHRILYRSALLFPKAVEQVAALVRMEPGRRLLEFLRAPSKRGYARKRSANAIGDDADAEP